MAKVRQTNQHDWLGIWVTFADGTKADVTWSRGGENVKIAPPDPKRGAVLSAIVIENRRRLKDPAYPFENLGQTVEAMAKAGDASLTLDDYLEALKRDLKVSGEPPKPKAAGNAPATTRASVRKSRGWILEALFPTGERVELKINQASIGLALDPPLPTRFNDITGFAFGLKQMRTFTDEEIAVAAKEAAEATSSVDEFIELWRAQMVPGSPTP